MIQLKLKRPLYSASHHTFAVRFGKSFTQNYVKSLTSSLQYFMVQKGSMSNKEAIKQILAGQVLVNGQKGQLHQVLQPEDEVLWNGKVLKAPQVFTFLAYYKPRGVESTLNPTIPQNLGQAISVTVPVFPVGRLDKESEGLMLLTDNGKIYNRIIHAESHQEKEYEVTVDKTLTPAAVAQLAAGVVIMGKKTRPAKVKVVAEDKFTIILTQGLNRQIRRMCYQLGYQVQVLVRTRIVSLSLGDLAPGQWRRVTPQEMQELLQATATNNTERNK